MKYVLLVLVCVMLGCGGSGQPKPHIPMAYIIVVNDPSSVHNIVRIQWLDSAYVEVDVPPGDASDPIPLVPFKTYLLIVSFSCLQYNFGEITTGADGSTLYVYTYDPP